MSRMVWFIPIFIIGLLASAAPTAAGVEDVVTIDLTGSSITACNFSPGLVEGYLVVVATNIGGGIENPSGTPLPFTVTFSSGATSAVYNLSLAADDLLPFGISLGNTYIPSATVTVSTPNASANITVICDIPEEGENTTPVVPSDGRINMGRGDLINAIYNTRDDSGQPALGVWAIDADSKGIYTGRFAYELFEPYLDAPPSENTRLAVVGQTTLYALTSGEFQVVVGPDDEGKTYTTVFSGLPVRGAYQPKP